MQSLPLQEVQVGPNDRVFRHARMRALIGWLVGFALAAALFVGALTNAKWRAEYIFGPFLLLFLLLTLKFVTARFHPSNWLVRMNDSGIYVQFRSYLNYGLPSDGPSVVFLAFGEIVSARLVKVPAACTAPSLEQIRCNPNEPRPRTPLLRLALPVQTACRLNRSMQHHEGRGLC